MAKTGSTLWGRGLQEWETSIRSLEPSQSGSMPMGINTEFLQDFRGILLLRSEDQRFVRSDWDTIWEAGRIALIGSCDPGHWRGRDRRRGHAVNARSGGRSCVQHSLRWETVQRRTSRQSMRISSVPGVSGKTKARRPTREAIPIGNTGSDTGTVTFNYDDGDRCTASLMFDSTTSGTATSMCDDGSSFH